MSELAAAIEFWLPPICTQLIEWLLQSCPQRLPRAGFCRRRAADASWLAAPPVSDLAGTTETAFGLIAKEAAGGGFSLRRTGLAQTRVDTRGYARAGHCMWRRVNPGHSLKLHSLWVK